MKTKHIALLLLLASFYSCVKDSNYKEPNYQALSEQTKAKIEDFKGNKIQHSLLKEKVKTYITQYEDDDAFEGVVISSDEGGNFYKKLYVQALDKTGTISVVVEKKGLYGEFPVGQKVQVRLKETTIWYNSKSDIIEVGYGKGKTVSGNTKMEGLPTSMYNKVIVSYEEMLKPEDFITTLNGLSDIKIEDYTNKIVRISNIHFDVNAVGKTFYNPKDKYNTDINIEDNNNKKLKFTTSSFAYHAKEIVPNGGVIITGILTKYANTNQLTINSYKDIEINK